MQRARDVRLPAINRPGCAGDRISPEGGEVIRAYGDWGTDGYLGFGAARERRNDRRARS